MSDILLCIFLSSRAISKRLPILSCLFARKLLLPGKRLLFFQPFYARGVCSPFIHDRSKPVCSGFSFAVILSIFILRASMNPVLKAYIDNGIFRQALLTASSDLHVRKKSRRRNGFTVTAAT
jgi:hypothetical protein